MTACVGLLADVAEMRNKIEVAAAAGDGHAGSPARRHVYCAVIAAAQQHNAASPISEPAFRDESPVTDGPVRSRQSSPPAPQCHAVMNEAAGVGSGDAEPIAEYMRPAGRRLQAAGRPMAAGLFREALSASADVNARQYFSRVVASIPAGQAMSEVARSGQQAGRHQRPEQWPVPSPLGRDSPLPRPRRRHALVWP